jgi:predicted nucleic acid-binding protein
MPEAEPAAVAVLDASVAVRWLVPERGSEEAAALLEQPLAWIAPRLMLVEVAGALRRKAAGREITAAVATQALQALVDAVGDGTIRLADDEDLVTSALGLALAVDHPVSDCLYLALAEREGTALATADRRLDALARRRGIPTQIVPSA